MNSPDQTRLLALLVHRGFLTREHAQGAMASGDPKRWLVAQGHATAEQWEEWVATDAGARPELSRYELGELLGEGGSARVFRATDRTTGDSVALKVLRPELAADPRQVEQFVREAKSIMELASDHIVKGLRVAREGQVFYFAMELIEGECLQDILSREGRLPESEALDAVVQVARALGALHEKGLVHRDVKPGNVIRAADGRCVLIDLGFAQRIGEGGSSETTAGTAAYIAPEQARGQGALDVRADIYALGATLYHLVTGSLPFSGDSSEEILRKQVLESLSGERIRDLELSPQLHFFIEKMMAKDAANRFQDPIQLAEEVGSWVERQRAARQRNEPRKPGSSRRRRRLF